MFGVKFRLLQQQQGAGEARAVRWLRDEGGEAKTRWSTWHEGWVQRSRGFEERTKPHEGFQGWRTSQRTKGTPNGTPGAWLFTAPTAWGPYPSHRPPRASLLMAVVVSTKRNKSAPQLGHLKWHPSVFTCAVPMCIWNVHRCISFICMWDTYMPPQPFWAHRCAGHWPSRANTHPDAHAYICFAFVCGFTFACASDELSCWSKLLHYVHWRLLAVTRVHKQPTCYHWVPLQKSDITQKWNYTATLFCSNVLMSWYQGLSKW